MRRLTFRPCLRALIRLMLACSAIVTTSESNTPAFASEPIRAGAELFNDRAKFEARLGSRPRLVNFDDIETPPTGHVPFPAGHYAARGLVITGQEGQYVSREFGYPSNFRCVSA